MEMDMLESSTPNFCETPFLCNTHFQFPPPATTRNNSHRRRSFSPTGNIHILQNIQISPIEASMISQSYAVNQSLNDTENNNNNNNNCENSDSFLMPSILLNYHKKNKTPPFCYNEEESIIEQNDSKNLNSSSITTSKSFLEKTFNIVNLLDQYGLSEYSSLFRHMSLWEFSNLNNEDLIKIGVHDMKARNKILKCNGFLNF